MAVLEVLLHGQEIAKLELEAGQEYFIGRGSTCHIQLPNEKGISRQHLKVFEQDGIWIIELQSKTGNLILEGENVGAIELSEDCRFAVPPFEFQFEFQSENNVAEEEPIEAQVTPEQELPEVEFPQTSSEIENLSPEEIEVTSNESLDSTDAGVVNLVPVLKVENESTGEKYSLKLDGKIWTAGRHPDSEINIQDNAISRKHFEIALVGNGYSIKDLGSSNGTHVNDVKIEPNELAELQSGDKISVRHITIHFEVRDKNHEQKIAGIKEMAVFEAPNSGMDIYQGPAVMKMEADEFQTGILKNPKFKKALIFGAPILLVLAIFVGGDDDKKDLPSVPSDPVTTQQDLEEVKHLLEVARGHYQNQNFSFCLIQLQKLHKILPSYEDSKDMESLCGQAIELEKEQADRDATEKSRQEVQIKIQNIIDNCEASKTGSTTSAEMQICLQPALELNPEQPRALALISEIENIESQAQNIEQIRQAKTARIRSGKAAFSKAVRLEKQGKFKSAKKQYYRFIRGGYGLQKEEATAKRSIASIDKNLNSKVMASVSACEKLLGESKYKEAISKCNEALKIDSSNAKAKSALSNLKKKLRIDMKKIWDSSVLEESFGNLEAAKARWKEILQKSVPRENYYEKAQNKLKSYGIL